MLCRSRVGAVGAGRAGMTFMVARSDPVILVAEDNDGDVVMLRRAFQHLGVTAPLQFVADGEETVAYLKGTGKFANRDEYPLPDILLLDLKMPRLNGLEFLEWWRKQPSLSAIRIVVLTTSEEIRDVNAAYRLGASSFLVKPFNFDEFRNTIFAMLQYWRNNQPGVSSREPNIKPEHENGSAK
jgi:CheY-like chemotaxis protein